MFPILNITAKGILKFIYNIGSSFSSNFFKFTIGKGLTDN